MTSMLERAARALCLRIGRDPDAMEPGNTPYGDEREMTDGTLANGEPGFFVWRLYEGQASAVLQAIRLDPSEQSPSCSTDIVDAGRNAWMEWEVTPNDFKRANAATVDCWNAMIDAALSEDQDEFIAIPRMEE